MPPINLEWDSQDAIPEQLKPLAVERDGKWIFEAEAKEEVAGLKAALNNERKRAKQYEQLAKQYDGIDPDRARQILDEASKAEEEKAKAAGQWENWKAQMQQQHESEKGALTKQLETLKSELHRQMITANATMAISAAKGIPALLLPHIGASVIEENGSYAVRIMDGDKVRYGKNGEPMTIAERIEEMKADPVFGRAFEASGNGGSGAPPMQTGSGARNQDWMSLSPTERLNAARQAGIKQ